MRPALFLLALIVACGKREPPSEIGPAPSLADVPVSRLPAFEIDTSELDAMLAEVNTAIARWHQEKRAGLPPEIVEPVPGIVEAFAAATVPRFERTLCIPNAIPIADGWLAGVRLGSAWSSPSAFIQRTPNGIRIHERRPVELARRTRVKSVRGVAWIDPDRAYDMRLRLTIVVESDDRFARLNDELFFRVDCTRPELGLAVHSVSVEGGGQWTSFAGHLFVETRGIRQPTTVTFDVQPMENRQVVRLSNWVPSTSSKERVELDLVTAVKGQMRLFVPHAAAVRAPPGWTAVRLRGLHAVPGLAVAREGTEVATLQVRGGRLQLAGTIARCTAQVGSLVERLPDLAPMPELAIVESPAVLGTVPYVGGVILLEPQRGKRICDGEPTTTAVVLHELAHAWCPGSTPDDNLTAARLCESIANYVAASVATPAELAFLLETPDHPVFAVGIAQRVAVPDRDDRFVSYQKGMLILRAIERRIGVEEMRAVLRDFFKRWRDQPVTWAELARSIEIVAGPEAAADARRRFADPAWPDPW